MEIKKCSCGLVLVIIALFMFSGQGLTNSGIAISSDIEKALLTEDWETVAAKVGPDEQVSASPVLRAIKGHACLALNHNNESLLLFLSISDEPDLFAWKKWTTVFAEQNPGNPVAHYLRGDALARLEKTDEAIAAFNRSLRIKGAFVLSLNARGVAHASMRRWNEARADLEEACRTDSSLAELFVSIGTLQVLKRAPDGAVRSYRKALDISPDHSLAHNGLGCAYYGLGEWEMADTAFTQAAKRIPLPLFLANLRALSVAAENLNLPGMDDSPLFRFTDFLDWHALRQKTANECDILPILFGYPLPEELDSKIIKMLNRALESHEFYSEIKGKLELKQDSEKLISAIENTRALRHGDPSQLTDEERDKIILLNRLLIEHCYPFLIAKHDQRDPGMQLAFTQKGLEVMSQPDYKMGLSPYQLEKGYERMEDYAAISDALKTLPFTGGFTARWDKHLAKSMETSREAYRLKTGRDLDPGGVSMDMRRIFVDRSEWPVVNWFGLAHNMQSQSATPAEK
jgi:tetratricopeptide (TPR) repeat protein